MCAVTQIFSGRRECLLPSLSVMKHYNLANLIMMVSFHFNKIIFSSQKIWSWEIFNFLSVTLFCTLFFGQSTWTHNQREFQEIQKPWLCAFLCFVHSLGSKHTISKDKFILQSKDSGPAHSQRGYKEGHKIFLGKTESEALKFGNKNCYVGSINFWSQQGWIIDLFYISEIFLKIIQNHQGIFIIKCQYEDWIL